MSQEPDTIWFGPWLGKGVPQDRLKYFADRDEFVLPSRLLEQIMTGEETGRTLYGWVFDNCRKARAEYEEREKKVAR